MAGVGIDPSDIAYISGSENDPGDSRGEDWLTVRPDDSFRLENRFRGAFHAWDGRLAEGTHAALVRRLEDAGFPDVPDHPIPGGSAMREVHHLEGTAMVAWHAAKDIPGWAEAFADLDGIVASARSGAPAGRVAEVTEARIPG